MKNEDDYELEFMFEKYLNVKLHSDVSIIKITNIRYVDSIVYVTYQYKYDMNGEWIDDMKVLKIWKVIAFAFYQTSNNVEKLYEHENEIEKINSELYYMNKNS